MVSFGLTWAVMYNYNRLRRGFYRGRHSITSGGAGHSSCSRGGNRPDTLTVNMQGLYPHQGVTEFVWTEHFWWYVRFQPINHSWKAGTLSSLCEWPVTFLSCFTPSCNKVMLMQNGERINDTRRIRLTIAIHSELNQRRESIFLEGLQTVISISSQGNRFSAT